MVEHSEGVNGVEAFVREVESFGVSQPKVDRGLTARGELLGYRESVFRQIDRRYLETSLCEPNAVHTDAAADLQQSLIRAVHRFEELKQVIVRPVSALFNVVEIRVRRSLGPRVVLVVDM